MTKTAALRSRRQAAGLLTELLHGACQRAGWREVDVRNVRLWREVVLAVVARRSTRLLDVGRVLLGWRRARTAKSGAIGMGYLLSTAQMALRPFRTRLLAQLLRSPARPPLAQYRGHTLLVIDGTEYGKRSRARGKRGRQMQ